MSPDPLPEISVAIAAEHVVVLDVRVDVVLPVELVDVSVFPRPPPGP